MTDRASSAIRIWRARTRRAPGDRAYAVYIVLMVGLVAVVPLLRAVWVGANTPEVITAIASPSAPEATMVGVAGLWAGALLWGRDRGPALRPPFLTHALATSDLTRSEAFRGPVLRVGAAVTASSAVVAGTIALVAVNGDLADAVGAGVFVGVGALIGVITVVMWVIGQVFPRAAVPASVGVFALGAFTAATPWVRPFTPWGWVGLTYPLGGSSHPSAAVAAVVALAALAAALVCAVPALVNRLSLGELLAQASRWESATTHAAGMEFDTAVAVYRRRPHIGRTLTVRPVGRAAVTFLRRDAIGALRTPGRLLAGILALMVAGVLISLAPTAAAPAWMLGATAGTILFAGLGPLTDGIRHAAQVAGDLPLYGISDAQLFARHALFPVCATAVVLLAVAVGCSALAGRPIAASIAGSVSLGMLVMIARISTAMKGPLPPSLLTPVPTPMGDVGAAVRLAWGLDGVLLAALAGAAAALSVEMPLLLLGVAVVVISIGINRWRHRR